MKLIHYRLNINNRQNSTIYDMKHLLQKYLELHRLRTVSRRLLWEGRLRTCAQTFALDLELFSLKLKLSQTSRVCGQMQKKKSILTRCSLAIVLINIQKSPSFLVALFAIAVCCIIFIKTSLKCVVSRLHINNRQKNTKYDMKHLLQKY